MLELPELPPCPRHPEGPEGPIADCSICWGRFYFKYERQVQLDQINRNYKQIVDEIERVKHGLQQS